MGKSRAIDELESAVLVVKKRPVWWVTGLVLGLVGLMVWLVTSRQS